MTCSMLPSESLTPLVSGLTIAYPRAVHSAGSGASNFSKSERRELGIPTRPGILSNWKKPSGCRQYPDILCGIRDEDQNRP